MFSLTTVGLGADFFVLFFAPLSVPFTVALTVVLSTVLFEVSESSFASVSVALSFNLASAASVVSSSFVSD